MIYENTYLIYEVRIGGPESVYSGLFFDLGVERLSNFTGVEFNRSNVNFYVVLHRDYNEFLDTVANMWNGSVSIDVERSCEIIAEKMYIVIRVINSTPNLLYLNLTLRFTNGAASCGPDYTQLPVIYGGEWSTHEDLNVVVFERLEVTRLLILDTESLEVISPSGEGYGEWPFWLGENDMTRNYTAIFYTVDETTIRDSCSYVRGNAVLLRLNMSRTATTDYVEGNITITKDDQIFTDSSDVFNVNPHLLSGLDHKPWKYVVGSNCSYYIGEVLYGNSRYGDIGYFQIEAASYARAGVLLYVESIEEANLSYMFPTVVIKAFAVTPISATPYSEISLR